MQQGWIKLHRNSLDSSVFANPNVWFVWSWCLLKASHDTYKFPFNGEDIQIVPGQFVTGRDKALIELKGLTSQNYRTAIKYLEKTQRLTIKVTNKFSLITVNKWAEYQYDNQQTNQQLTSHSPTTNQPLTTYKNYKNINTIAKPSIDDLAGYGNILLSSIPPIKGEVVKSSDKPKTKREPKTKYGKDTMGILAYAYAKASGADLTKPIDSRAWLRPLSIIYTHFDKDVDKAVEYINKAVAHYEGLTMRDGTKCNYTIRTIQNVPDVLRLIEKPEVNKSDIYF